MTNQLNGFIRYGGHCGVQYIALNWNDLVYLALSHVDGEHPAVQR